MFDLWLVTIYNCRFRHFCNRKIFYLFKSYSSTTLEYWWFNVCICSFKFITKTRGLFQMYLLVYIRKSNTNMHRYYSNSNLVYVLVENNIDCGDMHMRIVFRVVIYMYVMSILYVCIWLLYVGR